MENTKDSQELNLEDFIKQVVGKLPELPSQDIVGVIAAISHEAHRVIASRVKESTYLKEREDVSMEALRLLIPNTPQNP